MAPSREQRAQQLDKSASAQDEQNTQLPKSAFIPETGTAPSASASPGLFDTRNGTMPPSSSQTPQDGSPGQSQINPISPLSTRTPPSPHGPMQYTIQQSHSPDQQPSSPGQSKTLTLRLYISHFLSTWNSRLFEMGSVLFLAAIFPGTLLPMSVYALCRSGAAIVFSPTVGAWIDSGDRLSVVRASIVGQRLAVAGSCGVFWAMVWGVGDAQGLGQEMAGSTGLKGLRGGLFGVAVILACVEKLCSVMNLVAVERDWVVVITHGDEASRSLLNARMRRIDLFCKLVGPLVISLINGASVIVAIWVTLGMSVSSILVEYICIASVFKRVPALRRPTAVIDATATSPTPARNAIQNQEQDVELIPVSTSSPATPTPSPPQSPFLETLNRLFPLHSIPFYFHHRAFLPSISLSLLYLTVLSFSGQMITYLLSVGYTSLHIGIARTVSTVFELSATWIAPRVMKKIGPIRGGIWFLSWQMTWLAAGTAWFLKDGNVGAVSRSGGGDAHYAASATSTSKTQLTAASALVAAVILSRVGLWGFDLCAQNIVQDEVGETHRGEFSSVEAAWQNLFELLAYASTVVFDKPEEFRWPVVISFAAVYGAGGLYAGFVRKRRGHLVHAEKVICGGCKDGIGGFGGRRDESGHEE